MINAKAAIVAGATLAISLAGALWFGARRESSPSSQVSSTATAPLNAAHEKASLEDNLRKKPGHAPVLLRLAQLATEQGQTAEARSRLEELLRTEPSNLAARLELGRACYELNDLTCAIAETEKILAKDPTHADALYNLGAIHANLRQSEKARHYWEKAVQSAPGSESGRKSAAALKQLEGGSR